MKCNEELCEICEARGSACLACIFGLSELEMQMFKDFLVKYEVALLQSGLSPNTVAKILQELER